VAQVAHVFHMSASSLQRRLLAEGTTLATCLREVRMNTALSLLQTTTLPISDISERCGYGSHSRFTAAFKERFGYLPSYLRSKKELAQIDC
jgi:AraC-like DNA-binding protein